MKWAIATLAAGIGLVATVSTALAHAEPDTASPGDGAVLTQPPAEVVLVMSQDMFDRAGANDIDLLDAKGVEVTTVSAAVDRNDRKRLSVAVPSGLAPGKYTVKWKTLSADDGDPAEGSLAFTYDPAGTANPGKTQLREDVLGGGTPNDADTGAPSLAIEGADDGVTWILVVAVGVAMFVVGAGGTFLLVQRKP